MKSESQEKINSIYPKKIEIYDTQNFENQEFGVEIYINDSI